MHRIMKNQRTHLSTASGVADPSAALRIPMPILPSGRTQNGFAKPAEISSTPKVLMYHRLSEDPEEAAGDPWCITVGEFCRQIKLLERLNFTPITLESYALGLEGKLTLPARPIILTFDDGYLDTYRLAYPVLREHGMKAVVFVLGDRTIQTDVWNRVNGNGKQGRAPLLQDHHLVEMYRHGFEIGVHSSSHPRMNTLGREAFNREIREPKRVIESILGAPVFSFSYPYGIVTPQLKRLVSRAGYTFACSVYSGPAVFGQDPYEIRRIAIPGSSNLVGFATRVITPYEYLEWMWWKTRGYRNQSNGTPQ